MSAYNKINLQLGDIIEFNAPNNTSLHKVFYIKYIDKTQIDIINSEYSTSLNMKMRKLMIHLL